MSCVGSQVAVQALSGILGDGGLRRVRLSVVVEGGWLLATNASLDVRPQTPPNADRILVQPTHLGDLNASGPYLRVSAGLLFYGGWRVLDGHMSVGDLMMFLVYLVMLLEPLAVSL